MWSSSAGDRTPGQVPGWFEAVEYRVAPKVFDHAPVVPEPGKCAGVMALRVRVGLLVFVSVTFAWKFFEPSGAAWGWEAAWFLWVTAGAGLLCWRWRRVGDQMVAELSVGYTTFPMKSGVFRFPRLSTPKSSEAFYTGWVPWNYDGCWVLDRHGNVMSEPVEGTSRYPPGLYLSPRCDGTYDVWTGAGWAGEKRVIEKVYPGK